MRNIFAGQGLKSRCPVLFIAFDRKFNWNFQKVKKVKKKCLTSGVQWCIISRYADVLYIGV